MATSHFRNIVECKDGDGDTGSDGQHLPEPPGLTLGLEKAEDVVLTDCIGTNVSDPSFLSSFACVGWCVLVAGNVRGERHTRALDVTDDAAGGVVHELDADLGHTATGACSPQEVSISQAVLHIAIDWMAFSASEGRGEARRQGERQDRRTGAAEDAGDLDELDGNLGALHFV